MPTKAAFLILLALTISGCQERKSSLVRVSDEEVYGKRCGKCHKQYPANHFTYERWETFLQMHPEKKRHRPKDNEMISIRYFLGI